jgi:uncharacterized membrane protein
MRITNDAVLLGLFVAMLGLIFHTSARDTPFWRRFYAIVPTVLLAYFIPGLLNTLGIIDGAGSSLYVVARDYLLPTSLVLLTLSVDFGGIVRLGPKALVMFLVATLGVVIGGPVALAIGGLIDPGMLGDVGPESTWRGMAAQAGSWIGGGANQAAMKEVFDAGPDVFGKWVAVDIVMANLWLAALLFMAGRAPAIDRWLRADTTAIDELKLRIERFQLENQRVTSFADLSVILGIGFGATSLSHAIAGWLAPWLAARAPQLEAYSLTSHFFWVVVTATAIGLGLSFTRARRYEGAGASKIGSICLYVLIATIGMQMDLRTVLSDPILFVVGAIWLLIHATLLLVAARVIRAPVFFLAVGSQANIGGAASAPVVSSAFHPALAPVGVLLAVLGYVVGTYGGYLAGLLLRTVAT